jgi:AcrR family transcriptional regulator
MLGEAQTDTPTPGQARRDRRREATKAEILEAAWDLVREHGLAALALRDLAARVGMRAPSLYQYFDSKHAIYDAMFAQGWQQSLDEVVTDDLDRSDARTALQRAARRMFAFATNDPARYQLLFQRTIPGFEPSPESYTTAVRMMEHTSQLIADLGITDPDAIDLWTALISGLTAQQLSNDPGGTRWERLIDRTVDMYLAQVGPAAPTPKRKRAK